jgi:hypothetical protein
MHQRGAVLQVLEACEASTKGLSQTVDEVTRACGHCNGSPPTEVTLRLIQACRSHQDAGSLEKLSVILGNSGVKHSDVYNARSTLA